MQILLPENVKGHMDTGENVITLCVEERLAKQILYYKS